MGPAVTKQRLFGWIGLVALVLTSSLIAWAWVTYPSDRTPEGAYLRIMVAVNRGRPEEFFAYIETEAQHACYTIRDYRRRARDRVLGAYPEPERTRIAQAYRPLAEAPDGADVFGMYARERAWLDRLRRDMSHVDHVEVQGERATVQTVRGTRYPMRRRDNGIWGLTLFTAALVSEAEKVARDAAMVDQAARDYERARAAGR
jgi:hypothetical protein